LPDQRTNYNRMGTEFRRKKN